MPRVAVLDDLPDIGSEDGKLFLGRRVQSLSRCAGEFLAPRLLRFDLLPQLFDPWGADGFRHGALLKRVEVAGERGLSLADLVTHGGEICFAARPVGLQRNERLLDCVSDQGFLLKHRQKLFQDPVLKFARRDALCGTAVRAVTVDGEAGVVGVGLRTAGRGCADEALVAVGALEQAGEQEIAVVGAAERDVLATLGQDLLRPLEERQRDERRVRVLVNLLAPVNFSDVGRVPEDAEHDFVMERPPVP